MPNPKEALERVRARGARLRENLADYDKAEAGDWAASLPAEVADEMRQEVADLETLVAAVERGAVDGWVRLGDCLPEVGQSILLAHRRQDGEWRVRDASLYIQHEDVVPSPVDLANGPPRKWWLDSIYPGAGDLRLPNENMLWQPMPSPFAAPPQGGEG